MFSSPLAQDQGIEHPMTLWARKLYPCLFLIHFEYSVYPWPLNVLSSSLFVIISYFMVLLSNPFTRSPIAWIVQAPLTPHLTRLTAADEVRAHSMWFAMRIESRSLASNLLYLSCWALRRWKHFWPKWTPWPKEYCRSRSFQHVVAILCMLEVFKLSDGFFTWLSYNTRRRSIDPSDGWLKGLLKHGELAETCSNSNKNAPFSTSSFVLNVLEYYLIFDSFEFCTSLPKPPLCGIAGFNNSLELVKVCCLAFPLAMQPMNTRINMHRHFHYV